MIIETNTMIQSRIITISTYNIVNKIDEKYKNIIVRCQSIKFILMKNWILYNKRKTIHLVGIFTIFNGLKYSRIVE